MIRLILVCLIFIGCSGGVDYSQIKVIEVIDGDTVRLANGKLLRYIGIDTPELTIRKNKTFYSDPQPFSQQAKEFNEKLVENKFITIEFDVEKFDRYGRILGYCFVGDTFVNAKLLEEGFAVLYTYPSNVKYADLFLGLQKQARRQKRGLWGAYDVIDSGRAAEFINQIRTVTGLVLDSYQSKSCVYLNFGRDYKTDFTVVIFNNCLKFFEQNNINPREYYKGKHIEVTGRIKEYNGPEIIVCRPYEIRVSDENQ